MLLLFHPTVLYNSQNGETLLFHLKVTSRLCCFRNPGVLSEISHWVMPDQKAGPWFCVPGRFHTCKFGLDQTVKSESPNSTGQMWKHPETLLTPEWLITIFSMVEVERQKFWSHIMTSLVDKSLLKKCKPKRCLNVLLTDCSLKPKNARRSRDIYIYISGIQTCV